MKKIKIIDLSISMALFGVFFVLSVYRMDQTFITGYFVVGGWQVISMCVHALNAWFTHKGGIRRTYHWIVFVIICMGMLVFVIPFFFYVWYVMLFAAPAMALYYMAICWNEIEFISKREFIHLK